MRKSKGRKKSGEKAHSSTRREINYTYAKKDDLCLEAEHGYTRGILNVNAERIK